MWVGLMVLKYVCYFVWVPAQSKNICLLFIHCGSHLEVWVELHHRGLPFPTQIFFHPHNLSLVMLTFVTTRWYPTWKLHSRTCKDEIGSPLQYSRHYAQELMFIVVLLT